MRKILIIIALAASSCSLQPPCEVAEPVRDEKTRVTVTVSRGATRATGVKEDEEAAVNSLQVLVFHSDGSIDAVGKASGDSLTVNVTAGKDKRLWAVANAPDLSGVSREEELCGSISRLTDNSIGSFVMCGKTVSDIIGDTGVSIELVRMVAKVSLKGVTRQFDAPGLAARPLTVKGIYLINVSSALRLDGGGEVTDWLNRGKFESSGADGLLSDKNLSIQLSNGVTYSCLHSFYCYPNPTSEDSVEQSWSPRKTRLVLEAELDGGTCWYSLTFPQILRNCSYTIENLTLSGKGSPTPDTPYGRDPVSASVTVLDWASGSEYTEKL